MIGVGHLLIDKDSTLEMNGLLSTNHGKVQSFDPKININKVSKYNKQ